VTHLAVTHQQIQGQASSPSKLHCDSTCSHTSADPRSSDKSKQTAPRLTLQSHISRSKVKRQVQADCTVTHLAVTHRQIQGQASNPSRLHCDSPCSHTSADPRSSVKSRQTALRLTLQSRIGRSEVKRQVQADCTATHLAVTHQQIQGQASSPSGLHCDSPCSHIGRSKVKRQVQADCTATHLTVTHRQIHGQASSPTRLHCDSPCSHASADPRSSTKSTQTALQLTLQSRIGRSEVKLQVQADCTATHLAVTHQQIRGQAPSPSRLHCDSYCSHTSADPRQAPSPSRLHHLAVTHRQIQGQAPSPSRLHCDSPCSHTSADPRSSTKSTQTALQLTLQSHIGRSKASTKSKQTHHHSPCSHTSADPRSSAKSKQTAL